MRGSSGSMPNLWTVRTMFDVAGLVSDASRDIERRDATNVKTSELAFNASFIFGGQIKGEPLRLFRTYAETNFIEAESDTLAPRKPILPGIIGHFTLC